MGTSSSRILDSVRRYRLEALVIIVVFFIIIIAALMISAIPLLRALSNKLEDRRWNTAHKWHQERKANFRDQK
jgi:hypothetical protein